jgi:hypothetical protein
MNRTRKGIINYKTIEGRGIENIGGSKEAT